MHDRLHEISPGGFVLSYITESESDAKESLSTVVKKLEQLIQAPKPIETKRVKFLLPEGSGKFVFNYPFVSELK